MAEKQIKLLPSVMCVRAWELREHIRVFEEKKVAAIHFDVMDGHFVENIMLGTSYFRDIAELTNLPIDLHLMCHEPQRFLEFFKPREGDWVSFHLGARCDHPFRLLQTIRERGGRAGVVLDPGTPISSLAEMAELLDFVVVMAVNPGFAGQKIVPGHFEKLSRVRQALEHRNPAADIVVDGNTSGENAVRMRKAGANGFVVDTASGLLGRGAERFREGYDLFAGGI